MGKHSDPHSRDWEAVAKNETCVSINISEYLDIEGGKIIIKGKNRESLVEMQLRDNREIYLCISVGEPMFVELHTKSGISVKYVKGSGGDLYKEFYLNERSN
jgi:hypothetical protein